MTILRASTAYIAALNAGKAGQLNQCRISIASMPAQIGFADPAGQTLAATHSQNAVPPPYAGIVYYAMAPYAAATLAAFPLIVYLTLPSGKTITTNSDFVVNAIPDLATELLALGWVPYTPAANYTLAIPVS